MMICLVQLYHIIFSISSDSHTQFAVQDYWSCWGGGALCQCPPPSKFGLYLPGYGLVIF